MKSTLCRLQPFESSLRRRPWSTHIDLLHVALAAMQGMAGMPPVKLFTCPLWRCHGKRDLANTPIMSESCSSKHYSHMSCVVLDLIQSCSIILSIPRDFGNLPNSQIATLFSGKKICPFSTLPSICYPLICVHRLPYLCDKNHQITCKLWCQHGEGVNILNIKALLQVI